MSGAPARPTRRRRLLGGVLIGTLLLAILAAGGVAAYGYAAKGNVAAFFPHWFTGPSSPAAQRSSQPAPSNVTPTAAPPTPTPAPTPAPPGPRPIIFLPGILGSFLGDSQGETWPAVQALVNCGVIDPNPTCESQVLAPDAFAANGTPEGPATLDTTDGNPVLGGAISSAFGTWCLEFTGCVIHKSGGQNVYNTTAQNAVDSGYTVAQPSDNAALAACAPKCFVPVGYDWRQSAADNAASVLTIIDNVLAATKADRVDILAHSQGGLIAEALTHLPGSVGKIYRIVTLGTPYLGAPKALAELLYAEPCQFAVPLGGCLIDPRVGQSLMENYPGVAELLPSQAYYDAYGPSGTPLDESQNGVTTYLPYAAAQQVIASDLAGLSGFATPRDASLVIAAAQFHADDDLWAPLDPTIGLLRMIGFDATDASPDCAPTSSCYPTVAIAPNGDTITSVDVPSTGTAALETGEGDGTVPLYSASVYNPNANPPFDDRGTGRNMYWCGDSHFGLAQSTAVWLSADQYLDGATSYATDTVGAMCPDGTIGTLAGTGLVP